MVDDETNSNANDKDPPVTSRDRACAAFARAALFPMKVDWSSTGKHRTIYPALRVLDGLRNDVMMNGNNASYSSLFPRRVMLVPLSSSKATVAGGVGGGGGGETATMQWSGQPDIVDSTVEVIPDVLTVKCMECSKATGNGANAFVRTKPKQDDTTGRRTTCHEIVLCTNRVLQNDYYYDANGDGDNIRLEERRDLPPRSLRSVEEALAHQMTRIRHSIGPKTKAATATATTADSRCEEYARVELEASRAAECFYRRERGRRRGNGGEIRRGSCLGFPGFSLLPAFAQRYLQDRCVRASAVEATGREFGGTARGKECVDRVLLDKSAK